MTIIAVQCRLASSRLPNKALLCLGEKELLRWTLRCLKKVLVDEYWVACDEESYPVLSAIAESEGWHCFAGPQQDVLERYCLLAEHTRADIILRATADNPFLFYEAAIETLKKIQKYKCDYFAFLDIPHGSGVEAFSAASLLKAKLSTNDPYDHEHVGPALYNHTDVFNCIFEKAPEQWSIANSEGEHRTTVDTIADYRRAQRMYDYLESENVQNPYEAKQILRALQSSYVQKKPILIAPTVQKGRGTGHIRRSLKLVENLRKNHNRHANIFLYEEPSVEVNVLIQNAIDTGIIRKYQIINELPQPDEYELIVLDMFMHKKELVEHLYSLAKIISLDDGETYSNYIDYNLDILPSLHSGKNKNCFNPRLLELPECKSRAVSKIEKVLISIGGEDPAQFSELIHKSLQCVLSSNSVVIDSTKISPISNLSSVINKYDLVITHFGFTAFEALSAGCAVITVATSPIHKKLSKKYGLVCLEKNECSPLKIKRILQKKDTLYGDTLRSLFCANSKETLAGLIDAYSLSTRYSCPVCNDVNSKNAVISRDSVKTIKKCSKCGLSYISFCVRKEKAYAKDYFFAEYKNQYGKTYLDDFEQIKQFGLARMDNILKVLNGQNYDIDDTILDIGCAYGPFLAAANQKSFVPYGTDISIDAIEYVNNSLSFKAVASPFSKFDVLKAFGKDSPKNGMFRVVTMWYVIEHFQNLDEVLKKVNSLLVPGGVFAFSTPNALGISRKVNASSFFAQSPHDHFSIWDKKSARKILRQYGFSMKKVVFTGIHRHRYPRILQKLPLFIIKMLAKILCFGDTFEVYCVKDKDIK